jgi:ATP/ADP translocase
MGCLKGIITMLYGELTPTELVQASFFSLLLCFIVGIYWMMRSLKDSVFATIVGLEYQPMAKMLSLVVVTLLLFCYNKIVDCVPRHNLFAVICGGYSAVFVLTAVMLTSTTFGLNGPDGEPLPPSPSRWLGWIHYFAIESYGSLVVSLFWQYLNSQVNLKAAKAQYGLITAGGQVGAITGCTLVVGSKRFGVPQLYGFGGVLTLVSPVIVAVYLRYFPPIEQIADSEAARAGGSAAKRVQPGLFEGLRLLLKHPYVLGIFGVSAFFEIIATILDYQMKVGAAAICRPVPLHPTALLYSPSPTVYALSPIRRPLSDGHGWRALAFSPTRPRHCQVRFLLTHTTLHYRAPCHQPASPCSPPPSGIRCWARPRIPPRQTSPPSWDSSGRLPIRSLSSFPS